MRNRIKFIIIMVMAIVCTMTANAQKYVYFATHRFVQDEFGEISPKYSKDAYCPTRIEVDLEQQTLLIKTKTHGTVSYTISDCFVKEDCVHFFDEKGNKIGCIIYTDATFQDFKGLTIIRNNNTMVTYVDGDKCF